MPWRVIVPYSLDADSGSAIRYSVVKPAFDKCGLRQRRKKAATWETNSADEQVIASQFAGLLRRFAKLSKNSTAKLDHLWIYIDRAREESNHAAAPSVAVKSRSLK